VFFYFCFIQALEFRIRYITCKLALRPSRWTGLHRGCANLRACDLGTLSYPASASNALLLSAIPAASHLDIEKYWTWHYTTEMLLKFKVFWFCDMSLSEKFHTFQRTFCLQQIRNFPLNDTASHLTRPECSETQLLEPHSL